MKTTTTTNSDTLFYNKDESLTAYALLCGYIQQAVIGNREVCLYKEGNYSIKVWNTATKTREVWDFYESLTKAKKAYKVAIKQAKLNNSKEQLLNIN